MDWALLRAQANQLLEQDARLEQLVRLVGAEALPDRQRWVLLAARLLKEGFLQQNALHETDAYCVPKKQARLLAFYLQLFELGRDLIEAGVPLLRLQERLDLPFLLRLKETIPNETPEQLEAIWLDLKTSLLGLRESGGGHARLS